MRIEPFSDSITDYKLHFGALTVGVKELNLLNESIYIWAALEGAPKISDLKEARRYFAEQNTSKVFCNVLVNNERDIAFAKWFGFMPVQADQKICRMELV